MLDQLRRHSKTWITKSILGFMTVGLIFYFGYAGVRKATRGAGGDKSEVAAFVNGESIPLPKFEQSYENQMKLYEQLTKGQVPASLSEMVKQNVLQKMIQTKLFAQQAKTIGLTVSDKELIQDITSNPNFMKDGFFNKKLYLDGFKPNYQQRMGEDYEFGLREDLLAEKFEDLIRNSVSVSDEELRQEYLLTNTQLNLQKITLDPNQFTEDKENKLKEAEGEILAALKEKAPAKGPSPLEALKKKYNLKVEETGLHSLRDKAAFAGDPAATSVYECLFKLSSANPLCPEGYSVGNDRLFFKLVEKKEPEWAKFEEQKESIRQGLVTRRQALIVKEIGDNLAKEASIRTQVLGSRPNS